MFSSIKHIHFVGIGGIGMSGIAEILIDQGFKISGSDKVMTSVTEHLERLGAKIYSGHDSKNLPRKTDILVYSSAVPKDNLEIAEALKRGIPIVRRAEMLAEVMRLKYGIGIAGTHGKTTTTSMTSLALIEGGIDPTVIVGGKLSGLGGTNARLGKGDFIVVEADEYDRSFLALTPTIAVLTTMEEDHLDIYHDLADIRNAFVEFANKVPFYGFVVLCNDETSLRKLVPDISGQKIITYGMFVESDLMAKKVKHDEGISTFEVRLKGKRLGKIRLKVPGDHNVKNALAAIAVALELNIPFRKVKAGIEKFGGVYRRWEKKGSVNGIDVYDDYAHHPTECAASLEGVKAGWQNRVVCVFQPHLFSRTKDFYKEFARSLSKADVIIITDVYPAREKPIKGVSGALIADEIRKSGHKEIHYIKDKEEIPEFLQTVTRSGDIVVTMGAGDIWKYGVEFLNMKEKVIS
jgi:UDP-N-acetylmuramate--alanine ligase